MEGGALESSHFEDEIPPHVWSQEVRVGGQGAVDVKEGERKRVYVCVINQKLRDGNVSKQNHPYERSDGLPPCSLQVYRRIISCCSRLGYHTHVRIACLSCVAPRDSLLVLCHRRQLCSVSFSNLWTMSLPSASSRTIAGE